MGSYFVTWPGVVEDSLPYCPIVSPDPHSLTEAELASSDLDPELAVSLWASMSREEDRDREKETERQREPLVYSALSGTKEY